MGFVPGCSPDQILWATHWAIDRDKLCNMVGSAYHWPSLRCYLNCGELRRFGTCNLLQVSGEACGQQTRGAHPRLFQCWPSVFDAGPTLKQPWVNAQCLLRIAGYAQTREPGTCCVMTTCVISVRFLRRPSTPRCATEYQCMSALHTVLFPVDILYDK